MRGKPGCVIYVGELPCDISERELDDLFYKVMVLSVSQLKIYDGNLAFACESSKPRTFPSLAAAFARSPKKIDGHTGQYYYVQLLMEGFIFAVWANQKRGLEA